MVITGASATLTSLPWLCKMALSDGVFLHDTFVVEFEQMVWFPGPWSYKLAMFLDNSKCVCVCACVRVLVMCIKYIVLALAIYLFPPLGHSILFKAWSTLSVLLLSGTASLAPPVAPPWTGWIILAIQTSLAIHTTCQQSTVCPAILLLRTYITCTCSSEMRG